MICLPAHPKYFMCVLDNFICFNLWLWNGLWLHSVMAVPEDRHKENTSAGAPLKTERGIVLPSCYPQVTAEQLNWTLLTEEAKGEWRICIHSMDLVSLYHEDLRWFKTTVGSETKFNYLLIQPGVSLRLLIVLRSEFQGKTPTACY